MARQRTLRAAMDWSHELLSQGERMLLRRLSVFAGGFTLEAAEAMCGGASGEEIQQCEVLDLLSRLVDKSLVLVGEQDGEARYRLLETIRQYGWEKLERSGETAEVRRRHAGFLLKLAEEAGPELKGPRQGEWLERLETEYDNLRAAMRWLLEEGGAEAAARLAWALWLFWFHRGHQDEVLAEGRVHFEESCEYPDGARTVVATTLEVWEGEILRQVETVVVGRDGRSGGDKTEQGRGIL